MSNITNKSDEEILEGLLQNIPSETGIEVSLPSKGLFYKNNKGTVSIEPLNFESTKRLVSLKNSNKNGVNEIIRLCVKGIEFDEICAIDKLYLLVKIREISYGDNIIIDAICQKCAFDNKLDAKLSQLTVNSVPDDEPELREFKLPVADKTVKLRIPKIRDEEFTATPDDFMDNLWRFVVEVEGHTKATIISNFIRKLGIRDINALVENIARDEYGVDTGIKYECDKCGSLNISRIPIDETFFTMRS